MTLTLYHNAMSTCSAKVRMVLSAKGLKWEGVHLDLRSGDQQKPDYVKLNPNRVVPTLVHDEAVIIESIVICEYLDDAFSEQPVRPNDLVERAKMRLWTKQLDEGVHGATSIISNCIAFRYQHLQKTPEAIETYLNNVVDPIRRERLRRMIELGMDAPDFEDGVRRFEKLLDDMEAALEHGPWLSGNEFSLADISYASYMARLQHLGFEERIAARPRTAEWAARLMERPSYKQGIEAWFDPKYLSLFESQREAAKSKISSMVS
ncbi:MAG: glutathione S-transferase family protein [Chloroflexota bacterium]